MCDFFPRLEVSRARPRYPYIPRISPGVLSVSLINSVHINIYSATSISGVSINGEPL